MSRSSANPEALIGYAASMHTEGQAVIDHLGRAGITEQLDAVRTRCSEYVSGEIPDVAGQARTASLGAQELDVWAGAVGQGFLLADTSGAAVVHVEDEAVIANLPPGLADPPAETQRKLAEGQRLFNDLMVATEERDHDRIEEIMATLEERQGDTVFMAGFATKVEEIGGIEELQERIEDGLRPKNREGILGGIHDYAAGVWVDFAGGTVEMIASLSIFQLFADPRQYAENWANLGRGLWHGLTNPGEFFDAVIDVEGFRDNPERWLGALVPDLILTVGSRGPGAAARVARVLAQCR